MFAQEISCRPVGVRSRPAHLAGIWHSTISEDTELIISKDRDALLATLACSVCRAARL